MRVFSLSLRNSVFSNVTADSPNGLALKLHTALWSKIPLQPLSDSVVKGARERGMLNWGRQNGEEVVTYSLMKNTVSRPGRPSISVPAAHILWVRVNPLRTGEEFIVHYGDSDVSNQSVYSCERFEPMIADILTHLGGSQTI